MSPATLEWYNATDITNWIVKNHPGRNITVEKVRAAIRALAKISPTFQWQKRPGDDRVTEVRSASIAEIEKYFFPNSEPSPPPV